MGLYVELPNTVEGLVHVNTLRDDYYTFDQDAYELRGDVTGKVLPWDRRCACVWQRQIQCLRQ